MIDLKNKSGVLVIVVLFLLLSSKTMAGSDEANPVFNGVMRAIDGDTLMFKGKRLRIFGLAAPEMSEPRGPVSLAAMDDIVNGRQLTCEQLDIDRYKRPVVRCFEAGRDIAKAMIRSGWAFAYRFYTADYDATERLARKDGIGFWQRTETEPQQSLNPLWIALTSALFGIGLGMLINRKLRLMRRHSE